MKFLNTVYSEMIKNTFISGTYMLKEIKEKQV